MFVENNKLIVKKGYFDFDQFYSDYQKHEQKRCVIHFRIKTHGKINEENCHPYNVSDKLAFVHNGTINVQGNKDYSDTWHFNEQIIKPLYKDNQGFLKKVYNKKLIGNFIGWSKLIFMDNKGRVNIINEEKGEWNNGVWYSNNSYLIPTTYLVPKKEEWTNKSGGNHGFLEGEYLTFNQSYGTFKKGQVVYLDEILRNGYLRVVSHNFNSDNVVEITRVVPWYVVDSFEDMEYAL